MNNQQGLLAPTALAILTAVSFPAYSAAEAVATNALDEVIVTANKRSERLQDVAVSVSSLSGATLERMHVAALADISGAVPGLVISNTGGPGRSTITMRGLNSQGNGSLVATLIDDMAVGSSASWAREDSYQLDLMPYDIAAIELLRGPQGTLYGANSMGGVLKYAMRYPSLDATEAQVGVEALSVSGGGSGGYGVRGAFGAPLVAGKLAVRVSVFDRKTPGFIDNPTLQRNNENTTTQKGARVALLWQLTDAVSVKLQALHQEIQSAGSNLVAATAVGEGPVYSPGEWLDGPQAWAHTVPESFRTKIDFGSVTIDWNLPFGHLTSASSYSKKITEHDQDMTLAYGWLQPLIFGPDTPTNNMFLSGVGVKKFTQELRLSSAGESRLSWLLGAYYTKEDATNSQDLEALGLDLAPLPGINPFALASVASSYKERAVFGNLSYQLTPALAVSVGLRRLKNEQLVNAQTGGIILAPSDTLSSSDASITNFMANVSYHFAENTMGYVRVANGYRPGVPNVVSSQYPEIPASTQSDTMKNYEVGLKSQFAGARGTIDLSVFKIDWTNMQAIVLTADGNIGYGANAGTATSKGVEMSVNYLATEALRLGVNAAFTDAKATQQVVTASYTVAVGARLPTAPKWTLAATADYRLAPLGGWTPRVNAAFRYLTEQYSTFSSANPTARIPAGSIADLNLGLSRGKVDVALYVRNLADKRTFNSGLPQTNGLTGVRFYRGTLVQPRTVGLTVDYSF